MGLASNIPSLKLTYGDIMDQYPPAAKADRYPIR